MAALDAIILTTVVVSVAYFGAPVLVWTSIIAAALLLITIFGTMHFFCLAICWFLFLIAASFANLTNLRQKYFTQPLIKKVEKKYANDQ